MANVPRILFLSVECGFWKHTRPFYSLINYSMYFQLEHETFVFRIVQPTLNVCWVLVGVSQLNPLRVVIINLAFVIYESL